MTSARKAMVSVREVPWPALDRLRVAGTGVEPVTFASSAWNRWATVGVRVCVAGLAGAAVLGWGTRHGIDGGAGGGRVAHRAGRVPCGASGLASRVAGSRGGGVRRRHHVRRSPHPPQLGGRRGGPALREDERPRPIRVLRLLSIDRQREVTFDDRLPRFEQLMGLVETGVRHVGGGTPSSWGRLWPQSQGGPGS